MSSENEMTVPEMQAAGTITATDLLYLIQGTDEDRDRYLTIAALLSYLSTNLPNVKIAMQGGIADLEGGSLTFTSDSENYVKLSYEDGVEISIDGGVAKLAGGGITFTANSGARVKLSFNGGLEFLNSAGELLYGVSRTGEIKGATVTADTLVGSYSYGAGFKNAAAGNYAQDVTHDTMSELIAAASEMKYFARLANATGTRTAFTIDVGTSEGYQIGEEIVLFNATGSSIAVKNSAGNQIAELEGGDAAKFMLIMVDSSEANAIWVHLS